MANNTAKKSRGERGQEKVKNQENLKTLRSRLFELVSDHTYKELQETTGISDSSISSIVNGGRNNPKIDNLISIAKAFDVSIDYLVGLTNVKTRDWNNNDKAIDQISKCGISAEALYNLINCIDQKEIKAFNEILLSHFRDQFLIDLSEYLFEIVDESIIDLKTDSLFPKKIDLNRLYIEQLSDTIGAIKKYSDFSIENYKKKISELEQENQSLDQSLEEDYVLYEKNKSEISKYKKIISEREWMDDFSKELKRNMTKEEMNHFIS